MFIEEEQRREEKENKHAVINTNRIPDILFILSFCYVKQVPLTTNEEGTIMFRLYMYPVFICTY